MLKTPKISKAEIHNVGSYIEESMVSFKKLYKSRNASMDLVNKRDKSEMLLPHIKSTIKMNPLTKDNRQSSLPIFNKNLSVSSIRQIDSEGVYSNEYFESNL